jgi:hypothetical protein
MTSRKIGKIVLIILAILLSLPGAALCEGEILEFSCPSCGYRQRFVQGSDEQDQAKNVQHVIVVCERSHSIRNITIALDPNRPVKSVPLLARQYGTGRSELLGSTLPKFLVPGNTCPLFPITAYLDRNICPVDGQPGIQIAVVGSY